jgi:NAD-dependent dihydropyrimidine dehydrogenase PreA subunit
LPFWAAIALCPLEAPGRSSCREKNTPTPELISVSSIKIRHGDKELNMSQIGFYFNEKRCVKCHACEIACKLWNNVEIGPRWRTVVKVGTGKFPNVKEINVSLACMHCGDPPCLKACPMWFLHLGLSLQRASIRKGWQDAKMPFLFGQAHWLTQGLRRDLPD